MSLKWKNTAQFNKSVLMDYATATGKDMAYTVNRALRNVGYKSAEFTPLKEPGQIENELRKDKIALKIVTKKLRGRVGSSYTTRKGKVRIVRRVTRKQIGRAAKQLIQRRQKRRGFLRRGWVAAMQAAGIRAGNTISGSNFRGKSKLGTGKQATPGNLRGFLGNAVWGRLDGPAKTKTQAVMMGAVNKAMRFVEKDMKNHASERMKKTAKKYSSRKR